MNENLVVNLGLRLEHENGLAEEENRFIVGWGYDTPFPVQVPGMSLTGGFQYAGTGGKDTQSDPKGLKLGPRAGFVYSLNDQTVVRGGWGIFWAPHQYPGPGANTFATRGYTAITNVVDSNDGGLTPSSATLSNPYPNGVDSPVGNSLGALTGAGRDGALQRPVREVPVHAAVLYRRPARAGLGNGVKIGYLGSRGNDLWIGGTNDSEVNINQLDPSLTLARQRAERSACANPFFGNSAFGSLADSATLPRGQLLRPYPHFRDVWAHHISEGKSSYNALRLEFEKKFRQWGARVNYTLSSYHSNTYREPTRASRIEETQVFNTTIWTGRSAPRAHRLSAVAQHQRALSLPEPGRRSRRMTILGRMVGLGGTIMRSGFPLTVVQSSNTLGSAFGFDHQRPNMVGDPAVSGGARDNFEQFVNPAAFENAPAYTFGNTPLHHHRPEDAAPAELGRVVRQVDADRRGSGAAAAVRVHQLLRPAELQRPADDLRSFQLRRHHRSRRIPADLPVHGEGDLLGQTSILRERAGLAARPFLF